ncbi:MAG: acetyl-CoA carboxylase biotin carboxyl carrier protein [Clostridiales bacterium]|nr:acetyl-CoA carboxylase biotin carboxyl carrier protein [Clostridiales bacterium]
MDLEAIFKLMDRVEKSSFTRVEIESNGLRVALERSASARAAEPAEAEASAASAPAGQDETNAVRSPISGVFYPAREPGSEPFVSLGARVEKGDTLCIIEAMKTMNEIRSPKSGVIAAILAEDGATVASGDTLFLLSEGN